MIKQNIHKLYMITEQKMTDKQAREIAAGVAMKYISSEGMSWGGHVATADSVHIESEGFTPEEAMCGFITHLGEDNLLVTGNTMVFWCDDDTVPNLTVYCALIIEGVYKNYPNCADWANRNSGYADITMIDLDELSSPRFDVKANLSPVQIVQLSFMSKENPTLIKHLSEGYLSSAEVAALYESLQYLLKNAKKNHDKTIVSNTKDMIKKMKRYLKGK